MSVIVYPEYGGWYGVVLVLIWKVAPTDLGYLYTQRVALVVLAVVLVAVFRVPERNTLSPPRLWSLPSSALVVFYILQKRNSANLKPTRIERSFSPSL